MARPNVRADFLGRAKRDILLLFEQVPLQLVSGDPLVTLAMVLRVIR